MNLTTQRFVHVGFGNMLNANRVEAILIPGTACAKRLQKTAKEQKIYFDLTFGRAVKSLLILEDGKLVGCALTPKTIAARINKSVGETDDESEGEDENEDT